MAKITANTYLLLIDPAGGTDYSEVVCLTAHSFSGTTATNDANSYCGPDSSPGELSSTITLSGFTELAPATDTVSAPPLFELWQDKTVFGWKIGPVVPASKDFVKEGQGYFSAYGENYDVGNAGQFSATITVAGDITQTVTP